MQDLPLPAVLVAAAPTPLLLLDSHDHVTEASSAAAILLGDTVGQDAATVFGERACAVLSALRGGSAAEPLDVEIDGIPCRIALASVPGPGNWVLCSVADMREVEQLVAELRQVQKLESIGRLAAGVAHEINTPVQYASDSVHFVRDVVGEVLTIASSATSTLASLVDADATGSAARVVAAADDADLGHLANAVPRALARALDGLDRVAGIVRSLKLFAHPGSGEASPVDLNQAVAATVQVARNEYRYVADLHTELGELPPVTCWVGEVNQAVLNLVVNAAHAIADVVTGTERRGTITVRTVVDGDHVVVEVADTGAGIPAEIQAKIFAPFFTTKPVGRGSGQGLAIVRSVAVDRHRGSVNFVSEVGVGTTFWLRLPIAGPGDTAVGRAA